MRKRWWWLLFVPLFAWVSQAVPVQAATMPSRPSEHYYYDDTNLLDATTQQLIDQKNRAYQSTKARPAIAVVAVKTTDGEALGDYAPPLFSQWGIGNKSENNGVMLLFARNNGQNNMRIEVGYGMEGELPDALAGRILNANLADIKAKDDAKVNAAIRQVFNTVATIIDKKYDLKPDANTVPEATLNRYQKPQRQGADDRGEGGLFSLLMKIIFIIVIVVVVLAAILGGGGRGGGGGRRGGDNSWWLWLLLGNLLSSAGRGGGRGPWSGGGGFGGGGGSSWGGGQSGGGGADV